MTILYKTQVVGEASKRRPPTKKKIKLIKKKRLKKKPSTTEGSDGGGAESTTAEGGSDGENKAVKFGVANDHRPGRPGRLKSMVDFRIMVE